MRGKIPFDPHIILYQGDAMQISNLVSHYQLSYGTKSVVKHIGTYFSAHSIKNLASRLWLQR